MLDSENPDWSISYGENITAAEAGCANGETECVTTGTTRLPFGRYVWWILPENDTQSGVWSRRGYFSVVQYPPDTAYAPIFADTPPMPDYLASIIDPTTSTQIKRITQPDGSYYPTQSYSKNQPWNADATMYKFYTVAVYNAATHNIIRELPGNLYESFWSNTDPDLLYGFTPDGAIRTYRISTAQTDDLYQLTGYDTVRLGPGEGNIDIHDKFVALAGKRGTDFDVIVFDLQKSRVVTTKTFTGAWGTGDDYLAEHIDWASVSQSGDYVVINWDTGDHSWDVQPFNGHYGIEVYDAADMSFRRRLVRYGNHGDLCFTPAGEEVYAQFWGENGTINAYHLADGQIDVIQTHSDFGDGDAHLSCRNILRPGWAYVSTDKSKGGMIVAVKLDTAGTVEYFGHHFSSSASYKKSPMPVPSPDGSVVMFKSDFGDDSNPDEAYAFEARYVALPHQIYLPLVLR